MRRFWVFPLFFAGLFTTFDVILEIADGFTAAVSLRFAALNTDIFYPVTHFNWSECVSSAAFGSVVGLILAALDFTLHPEDPRGDAARLHLLKFWRRAGLASAVVLFNVEGLKLGLDYWQLDGRYHAYSAEHQIFDWLSSVPSLFFLVLLVWTTQKTLRRPRRAN